MKEEFYKGKGVPWEPIPGRGRIQAKSRFRMGEGEGEIITEPKMKEARRRRVYLKKADVDKYAQGGTVGCRGCQAIGRGESGVPRNERCREIIEGRMAEAEPERYNEALA